MFNKAHIPGDDESAFHQHFLKRGGLHFHGYVDYGNMLRASLNIFHDKLETYKAAIPAFPAINCNFIDNPAVNAVASKLPASEQYYLGIHIGTFHILNDLFLRMLSSRTILPWVGDASKEKDTCKLFNPQIQILTSCSWQSIMIRRVLCLSIINGGILLLITRRQPLIFCLITSAGISYQGM
jgi:hypothetical protein